MTTTPPETPPDPGNATVELIGLALLLAGVVAVLVATFAVDWRLGLAVVGTASIGAGAWLTFRKV